ncbi:hypothetical protein Bbelb_315890 [Branchiostoma belcheri]|nr:hypothetical protein Bbelb_315890 [Branchiostoma belcheri]
MDSTGQYKTSSENLLGTCRVPAGYRPKRTMPARLLNLAGASRGYIPDGHRHNWDLSLTIPADDRSAPWTALVIIPADDRSAPWTALLFLCLLLSKNGYQELSLLRRPAIGTMMDHNMADNARCLGESHVTIGGE